MDTFIKKAFSVLKCTSVSTVDLAKKGCLTATIINHLIVKAVFYESVARKSNHGWIFFWSLNPSPVKSLKWVQKSQ